MVSSVGRCGLELLLCFVGFGGKGASDQDRSRPVWANMMGLGVVSRPCSGNDPSGLEMEDRVDLRPSVPSIQGRTPGPQLALPSGLNRVSSASVGLSGHRSEWTRPGETVSGCGKFKEERDELAVDGRPGLIEIGTGRLRGEDDSPP